MKMALEGMVSTSLRKGKFEQGENLRIKVVFPLSNEFSMDEIEKRFHTTLVLLDHSHLSESAHLKFKDFNELPAWLHSELKELKPLEIFVHIHSGRSLFLNLTNKE